MLCKLYKDNLQVNAMQTESTTAVDSLPLKVKE